MIAIRIRDWPLPGAALVHVTRATGVAMVGTISCFKRTAMVSLALTCQGDEGLGLLLGFGLGLRFRVRVSVRVRVRVWV